MEKNSVGETFEKLFQVITCLRSPGGCPWDMEQTPLSMRGPLVEECFEAVEAISDQDSAHVKEELGDVLMNILMITCMYEQENSFTLNMLLDELTEKLVRRHPHVFSESEGKSQGIGAVTSEQVLNQWDAIKKNVENRHSERRLDSVPKGFPPLLRAFKLQKKASKCGFDWTETGPVFDKVREELAEVMEAAGQKGPNQKKVEEEIGDLLFAAVNAARHLKVDPEIALNSANRKFYRRFSFVEERMKEQKLPLDAAHLKEMDYYWEEAKFSVDESQ